MKRGAIALKLVILTAARSNEVLGATWDEIDFKSKVWTVPATRMKAGKKEHRVPLKEPVLAILKELKQERGDIKSKSPYVFPNSQGDGFLSNAVMLALLKRMNRRDITVHGFRSTLTDWAAENLRTVLFEKRRKLMEEWNAHCLVSKK
jgi:integrase